MALVFLVYCLSATAVASAAVGGAWKLTGSLHTARALPMAVTLPNGEVLAAGGIDANNHELASAELYDPQTSKWTQTGSMNASRSNGTLTLLNTGKVLAAGGFTFPQQPSGTSAELYDPATGKWTPTGSLTTFRANHTATLLRSGKVLVAGGSTQDLSGAVSTAELYNPSTGKWTATNSMTAPRAYHAATLLASGQVLVSGGDHDAFFGAQGSAEIYDPVSTMWSAVGRMTTSRREHTATTLADGTVLVAGGRYGDSVGASNAMSMVDRFDPSTGIWSPVGDLKVVTHGGVLTVVGRDLHTATLLPDGRVLVAGGEGNINYTRFTVFRTAEIFDPQTNTWTFTGSMHVGRAQAAAVLLADGTVLMIGGSPVKKLVTGACEIFTLPGTIRQRTVSSPRRYVARDGFASGRFAFRSPFSTRPGFGGARRFVRRAAMLGKWTVTGSMHVPRAGANGFPAVLLPGGKVLVEGCDNELGQPGVTAELFDPGSGKWTLTGSMHVARCNHGAVLLPDGRVLVAGGDAGGIVSPTAEIYNPTTGKWSVAVRMNSTRYLFGILSTSGALIAPAGAAYGTIPRDSADLYNFSSGRWIATPSLNISRYEYGAVTLLDGKVLVFGGWTQNATWTFTSELYDPAANTWSLQGAPADQADVGVTLADGDVLATIPSQLYSEASGAWSATNGDMKIPRIDDTMTLLTNATVLAAGGCTSCGSGGGNVAQAEIYDPVTETWSLDAALHQPRSSQAAVRLKDGRVLVTGGLVGFTEIASAELYTPAK
jgi:N-acetylneuraminic acid mutarotase